MNCSIWKTWNCRIWCHTFQTLSFSRIHPCLTLWSFPFLSRMQVHTAERGGVLQTCLAFSLSVGATPNISLVLTNQSSTISRFRILWWCRHTPRILVNTGPQIYYIDFVGWASVHESIGPSLRSFSNYSLSMWRMWKQMLSEKWVKLCLFQQKNTDGFKTLFVMKKIKQIWEVSYFKRPLGRCH